jgi:hypothetical protein
VREYLVRDSIQARGLGTGTCRTAVSWICNEMGDRSLQSDQTDAPGLNRPELMIGLRSLHFRNLRAVRTLEADCGATGGSGGKAAAVT